MGTVVEWASKIMVGGWASGNDSRPWQSDQPVRILAINPTKKAFKTRNFGVSYLINICFINQRIWYIRYWRLNNWLSIRFSFNHILLKLSKSLSHLLGVGWWWTNPDTHWYHVSTHFPNQLTYLPSPSNRQSGGYANDGSRIPSQQYSQYWSALVTL